MVPFGAIVHMFALFDFLIVNGEFSTMLFVIVSAVAPVFAYSKIFPVYPYTGVIDFIVTYPA